MSKAYDELRREHLRLTMLRFLAKMPDYTMNASVLRDACESVGNAASRTEVEAEVAWLQEAALVRSIRVQENNLLIATITDRGLDAAGGRSVVPGVKRPSPSERG